MPDKKLTQLTPFSTVIETTDLHYKVKDPTGSAISQAYQTSILDMRYIQVTGSTMAGTLSLGNNALEDVNCVDFNVGFTGTSGIARLKWSPVDGTIEIGALGGEVVLQVGQESHIRGINKTGLTILNGQAVRISGAQGNRPKFGLADADNPAMAGAVGLATENIDDNAEGYVTTQGIVRDIDTSAFAPADRIWVGTTPGEITNVVPVAPITKIFIGVCIVSNPGNGTIFVFPINIPTISLLSDVLINSIADNDFLSWHSVSGTWINQSSEPHIIDADGALADITTKFNTLLSQLENLGFLSTS